MEERVHLSEKLKSNDEHDDGKKGGLSGQEGR